MQDGVPYAIDFLNPAPDADVHSVGPENFEWVVEQVAQLAIEKAFSMEQPQQAFHWSQVLTEQLGHGLTCQSAAGGRGANACDPV